MHPKLSRNTVVASVASFLVDVSSEMIFPLLPFFLTVTLGSPVIVVTLMEGLGEFAAAITALFFGLYSDKLGKRKSIVIFGYSLSALFKMFLIYATIWPQVVFFRVIERVGKGIRESPRDALIALSEKKENLEAAFGFRKLMDTAGGMLGPILSAALIALFFNNTHGIDSYRFLFTIAFMPAVLGVVVLLLLKEKEARAVPFAINVTRLLKNERVKRLSTVMALFALGQFSVLLLLAWGGRFFDLVFVPILYLAYLASFASFSFSAPYLLKIMNERKIIMLGIILFAIGMLVFAYIRVPMLILANFIVLGISMAVFETVPLAYLVRGTEEGGYASTVGFYRALLGIVALPSNFIAGMLWEISILGAPAPFLFSAFVALAALLAFYVVVRDNV